MLHDSVCALLSVLISLAQLSVNIELLQISDVTSMQELDEPEYNHFFVKKVVTRAMDKHNHEREMASILLSALHGEVQMFSYPLIPLLRYCT